MENEKLSDIQSLSDAYFENHNFVDTELFIFEQVELSIFYLEQIEYLLLGQCYNLNKSYRSEKVMYHPDLMQFVPNGSY